MAVTSAQVSVGRYDDQVMLHAIEHAEPENLSCLLLISSGSHSRWSNIFLTHPVFFFEKSLKTYLASLGKTCSKALMFACQTDVYDVLLFCIKRLLHVVCSHGGFYVEN